MKYVTGILGPVLWLLLVSCIEVPPEQPPAENNRVATVTVDHTGATIDGGGIIIDIPAGALETEQRIKVTIDRIRGTPPVHIGETFLVQPEGQTFLLPVTVTFRYQESEVNEVVDLHQLYVGVAEGMDWLPLERPQHDLSRRRVAGEVSHFSVFGLIDPSGSADGGRRDASDGDLGRSDATTAPDVSHLDAGLHDNAGSDAAATDHVASGADATALVDATRSDRFGSDGAAGRLITMRLTWAGAAADLDLHLLNDLNGQFSDSDCYYSNCKSGNGLEWPPVGPSGNPKMILDDMDGYGPEDIVLESPQEGQYYVAMHAYNMHLDSVPMEYIVRVYQNGALLLEVTRQLQLCDHFDRVVSLVVDGNGQATTTELESAPFLAGNGFCN